MRMKARELCPCTYNLLKLPSGAASLIPDRDKPCNVLGKFTALCCMALIAGTTGKKVRHPRRGFKEGEFGNLEVTQEIPGDFRDFRDFKSIPRAALLVVEFSYFLGSCFFISRRLSEQD